MLAAMAEPMVLVHGYRGTWRCWMPVWDGLARRYDVHALRLAGHFQGEELPDGVTPSIAALVDAAERDLDALGVRRAHLVGNSLGGWIVAELARRGRALSVVALSPAGMWEPRSPAERRLDRMFRADARTLPWALRHAESLSGRPRLRRLAFRRVMERADRLAPAEAASWMRAAQSYAAWRDLLDAMDRDGPIRDTGEITAPTLVAWAQRDRLLPFADFGRRWVGALPHSEVRILPGVGHVPMADDPSLVTGTIVDWAARHPAVDAPSAGLGLSMRRGARSPRARS